MSGKKKVVSDEELVEKKNLAKIKKREYDIQYRLKNKDVLGKEKRQYYRKNRKQIIEKSKAWAESNPLRRKEIEQKYRDIHRAECNTKLQKYVHKRRNYPAPTRERPDFCEICNEPPKNRRTVLSLDHCHKRNLFRGWLCSNCNSALGLAKDNLVILKEMINYIERFENEHIN